jgi:hypothetical protein
MGQAGHLGWDIRGPGSKVAAVATVDQPFDHPRPPNTPVKKSCPDNAIGRSRGGLSTKIDPVVDRAGMPVRIMLSQGQSSDKTVAPTVLERLAPDRELIAQRGYDARAFPSIRPNAAAGGLISRPAATADPTLGRSRLLSRALIERDKLKQFRNDKTARNFFAGVLLAATRLWIRFESTTLGAVD